MQDCGKTGRAAARHSRCIYFAHECHKTAERLSLFHINCTIVGCAISPRRQAGRQITVNLHTSCGFSVNVRQPYDTRTIVFSVGAGLLQDVVAELQGYHKWGRVTVVQTSWIVVHFVAFLRSCAINCKVIAWQSRGSLAAFTGKVCVRVLTLVIQMLCMSYSSKNSTNLSTTNEVCTTDSWTHLRQSCKSASPFCDSLAHECKTIVQASYGRLKFGENPHEECNFICDLLHGLTPSENHTDKWSYEWFETCFTRKFCLCIQTISTALLGICMCAQIIQRCRLWHPNSAFYAIFSISGCYGKYHILLL